ncbi:hypothetical protein T484DRAFT_2751472 [Baffinella frigidus]|nr:hypothetical protein T484DRAFT_2751472 [Cryptophyta sp. CCMP2293]
MQVDEEEPPEECLLVMKPCAPDVTTNEDECLDDEALIACVTASEEQLMAKMARLHKEDEKEEMLRDGSF